MTSYELIPLSKITFIVCIYFIWLTWVASCLVLRECINWRTILSSCYSAFATYALSTLEKSGRYRVSDTYNTIAAVHCQIQLFSGPNLESCELVLVFSPVFVKELTHDDIGRSVWGNLNDINQSSNFLFKIGKKNSVLKKNFHVIFEIVLKSFKIF